MMNWMVVPGMEWSKPLGTTVTVFAGNSPLTDDEIPELRVAVQELREVAVTVEDELADRPGDGLVEPGLDAGGRLRRGALALLEGQGLAAAGFDLGRKIGREDDQAAVFGRFLVGHRDGDARGLDLVDEIGAPAPLVEVDHRQLGDGGALSPAL